MTVESWHPVTCPAGRSIESGARPTRGPSTSVGTTISRHPELVEGPLVARSSLPVTCQLVARSGQVCDQREVPPLRSGRRSPVVPSLSKDLSLPGTFSSRSELRPTRGPSTPVGTTISRHPEFVEGLLVAWNVLVEARASTNKRSLHSASLRSGRRSPVIPSLSKDRSLPGTFSSRRELRPTRGPSTSVGTTISRRPERGRRTARCPKLGRQTKTSLACPGLWTLEPSNSHHPTPTTPFTIPPIVRPTPTEANS